MTRGCERFHPMQLALAFTDKRHYVKYKSPFSSDESALPLYSLIWDEYDEVEYGVLPAKYSVFVIRLCSNVFRDALPRR
jgi:hypothetical protein